MPRLGSPCASSMTCRPVPAPCHNVMWPHSESACVSTGHAPFPGDDPTRFADAAYRAPNRSDAPLPPLLTEVVHGLLTVDPARRLSARDALARLRNGGGERRLQAEVHDLRERNARLQARLDEAAADARRQVVAKARKSLPTRCTALKYIYKKVVCPYVL